MYDEEDELGDFQIMGFMVNKVRDIEHKNANGYVGFEIDGSYVELDGPLWKMRVLGKDIFIREGIWFEKNDKGEFEPDKSLSWFYTDKNNPSEYLYFKQDGIEVATYDFIKMYTANRD